MKNRLLSNLLFLITGFLLAAFLWINNASSWMMLEDESGFGFNETVLILEENAKNAGWSVSAIHDLQSSLAKKGKEVSQVKVMALCNPGHAEHILKGSDERIVSNLMPCRISVYVKDDGKTYVSRMNLRTVSRGMQKGVRTAFGGAFEEIEEIVATVLSGD